MIEIVAEFITGIVMAFLFATVLLVVGVFFKDKRDRDFPFPGYGPPLLTWMFIISAIGLHYGDRTPEYETWPFVFGYWFLWCLLVALRVRWASTRGSAGFPGTGEQKRKNRPGIPAQVRQTVWRRDGATCAQCGADEDLEFDHIVPVAKGGSNTEQNIQLLCARCNRSKGAKIQ